MNSWSGDYAYTSEGLRRQPQIFSSMCWGGEGYTLWLIAQKSDSPFGDEKKGSNTLLGKDGKAKRTSGTTCTEEDSTSLDSMNEAKNSKSKSSKKRQVRNLMQLDFVKSVFSG